MPLTNGQVTLGTVRAQVRQRADMVSSTFCTDAELNGWINNSYHELYDILATAYGENYYAASDSTIVTDGTSDSFALPTDFYKLLGVDVLVSGSEYVSLRPFNFNERNRFSRNGATGRHAELRYRVNGATLWLSPRAAASQTIRLWYVPRPDTFSDTATATLQAIAATNTITINGTTLTAVASGATTYQFNVGASDTATATNLAAKINTLASLLSVTATSSGTVVTVTSTAGAFVSWSSTTSVGGQSFNLTDWTNVIDGVSGWEEYIVVDCTIKAKAKEESDVSVEMAQKEALLRRIREAAANRDAGSPATVTDVYAADDEWPPRWRA